MFGQISLLSIGQFASIARHSRAAPVENLAHYVNVWVDVLHLSVLYPRHKADALLNNVYGWQEVFTCSERFVNFAGSSERPQAGVRQSVMVSARNNEDNWNAIGPRDDSVCEYDPEPITKFYNFRDKGNGNA